MAQVTPAAQLTITRASTATYVGANGTITTAVVNEPRYEFDPVTLAPKGLLVEQASTNLFLNSAVGVTQTITVVQGQQYSLSFWGTGTAVLSGGAVATVVGLGDFPATRAKTTFIATTTSVTVTVTDVITLVQFELGMPTSYIPTVGTAVTRAADVVNVDGVRYSNNVVTGQGSMYISFEPTAAGKDTTVALSLNDGTANNAFRISARNLGTKGNLRVNLFTPTTDYFAGSVYGSAGLGLNGVRTNGITNTEFSHANGSSSTNANTGDYDPVNNVVAFGGTSDSFLSSSDNGVTWIDRSISSGSAIMTNGIVVGSRVIVAAQLGFRLSTNNGISWRKINVTGQVSQQNEIAYNGTTTFVSVGNAGTAYSSLDNGETWNAVTTGRSSTLSSITFGGGLFVAGNSTGTATQAIITSPDGVTWTTRTTPSIVILDVAHNGTNLFVAVGNSGAIITSPDGITWTTRTSPQVTQPWRGVSFGNGQWVLAGDAGVVATSPDGITWTSRTSGVATTLLEVVYAPFATNPVWIAVGASGVIITSPDAITWTTRTSGTTQSINGVVANSTNAVYIANTAILATSPNGTTWTARTNQQASLVRMVFANGFWLCASNTSGGLPTFSMYDTSFNCTRLVIPLTLPTSNGTLFTYTNGRYYLGSAAYLLTSTDLVNFTIASQISTSFGYNNLAQNGDTVIVGSFVGGVIISTDNGATFTTSGTDANVGGSTCRGLLFRDNKYLFVSLSGNVSTSPDGVVWSRKLTSNLPLYTLAYNSKDNMYYVTGDNGVVYTSTDTETWTLLSNRATVNMANAGVVTFGNNLPNLNTGTNKIAVSFKTGSMSVAMNGANATTKVIGAVPVANRLSYGQSGVSNLQLNGYIKDVQFFKQPLSLAELTAITL